MELFAPREGCISFINWPGPILTDSGGFPGFQPRDDSQNPGARCRIPFAPGRLAVVSRTEGSHGNSTRTGLRHRHGVRRLPAAHQHSRARLRAAVERTMRWAGECREQPRAPGQLVFGIVQGGTNAELREECASDVGRAGFRRLRHRRSQRRRARAGNVARSRIGRAFPARREAALRDGIGHAGSTWSNWSRAEWTCSIACCRLASRATAPPSLAKAASASRAGRIKRIFDRSRKAAIALPAGISPGPICGTCLMWAKSWACECSVCITRECSSK